MLRFQQVDLHPLGVLVGDLGDVLVPSECLWCQRSHQVYENQLKRKLDFVISRLRVSRLVTISHGTHVAVCHGPVEAHPVVVKVL